MGVEAQSRSNWPSSEATIDLGLGGDPIVTRLSTYIRTLFVVLLVVFGVWLVAEATVTVHTDAKLPVSGGAAADWFGYAVAVSGDTVLVAAVLDDDAGSASGSAYVFTRSGTSWTQEAKLTPSDGAGGDWFGTSVALSGDTAVIGAHTDDGTAIDTGAAYVFTRSGTTWTQQAKLTPAGASTSDLFGYSVAVSGDTAVISALLDDDAVTDAGAVYVFTRSGTTWTQQATLTASDAATGDQFGYSVALSGDTAAVSSRLDDDAGVDSGSVYVFTGSGSAWTQQAKLAAADGAPGDWFGYSLAVSGDSLLTGAVSDGDAGPESGSAYVFGRSGTSWTEQAKLTASDAATSDLFGYSVALSDQIAVVGARSDDDAGTDSGSVYVFTGSGTTWTEDYKVTASDGAPNDYFGYSVAASGVNTVVGAWLGDDFGANSGSGYVFYTGPLDDGPGDAFIDIVGNTHRPNINKIAAVAVTNGCSSVGPRYCPDGLVTRGQMASFLARAFNLPGATGDHFSDDTGTTHEENINRIFEAGITVGFVDGTYEPAGLVTRAQMASFIARAMMLSPVPGDRFLDVSGVHEANINAIADTGVTVGCTSDGTEYCPDEPVRRDQMASFLARALDL